ncbi:MAG TPA: cytochrome D1 domain-containing protein [Methylophilaceae bacterium]|nr:cytochrome D1 domain-containing protein [Methylophilaceae bacterium]
MNNHPLATRLRAASMVAILASASVLGACTKEPETPPEAAPAPEASTMKHDNVAYVTNQDGGVTVIDLATMETISDIDVKGEGPRGVGVTDDGKLLITANKDNGNISVIDTATGKLVKHIEVGKNPEFVRVKGDYAFVSFEPSSKGGPPPKPGTVVKEEEDDDENAEPARIAVVDLKAGEKIREIVGGPETEGIEFSKDGKHLIITNEADNTITVHNMETGELEQTISTKDYGLRPRGIKASPDGSFYVATLEFGNSLLVLDSDFKPVKAVKTGLSPYGVSFDRDGKRIFVAANKAKTMEVYDAKTFDKIKEIPTGNRCWHFTFTPDDKQILLACGKSDEVLVIDTDKLEVTKHIGDKKMPWGLVTYPKSMGSLDQP